MTLADIATVANIVSSVALTISLVYVALQVRQAEKNQRGLMQQGRANRLTMDLMHIAEPHMASVWIKGLHAPETLAGEELERYLLICRATFISGEDSFLQRPRAAPHRRRPRPNDPSAPLQLPRDTPQASRWDELTAQIPISPDRHPAGQT